jgi:hypothetical protein
MIEISINFQPAKDHTEKAVVSHVLLDSMVIIAMKCVTAVVLRIGVTIFPAAR